MATTCTFYNLHKNKMFTYRTWLNPNFIFRLLLRYHHNSLHKNKCTVVKPPLQTMPFLRSSHKFCRAWNFNSVSRKINDAKNTRTVICKWRIRFDVLTINGAFCVRNSISLKKNKTRIENRTWTREHSRPCSNHRNLFHRLKARTSPLMRVVVVIS